MLFIAATCTQKSEIIFLLQILNQSKSCEPIVASTDGGLLKKKEPCLWSLVFGERNKMSLNVQLQKYVCLIYSAYLVYTPWKVALPEMRSIFVNCEVSERSVSVFRSWKRRVQTALELEIIYLFDFFLVVNLHHRILHVVVNIWICSWPLSVETVPVRYNSPTF